MIDAWFSYCKKSVAYIANEIFYYARYSLWCYFDVFIFVSLPIEATLMIKIKQSDFLYAFLYYAATKHMM